MENFMNISLEQIKDLKAEAKRKRDEAVDEVMESEGLTAPAKAKALTAAATAGVKEQFSMAALLSGYICNKVLAEVGISKGDAPFIVAALLSVTEAVVDTLVDDGVDRDALRRSSEDVAMLLAERRRVITVRVPDEED